MSTAFLAALQYSNAHSETHDADTHKFADFFLHSCNHYHMGSVIALARHLGISKAALQKKLARLVAAQLLYMKTKEAFWSKP